VLLDTEKFSNCSLTVGVFSVITDLWVDTGILMWETSIGVTNGVRSGIDVFVGGLSFKFWLSASALEFSMLSVDWGWVAYLVTASKLVQSSALCRRE